MDGYPRAQGAMYVRRATREASGDGVHKGSGGDVKSIGTGPLIFYLIRQASRLSISISIVLFIDIPAVI
jgi:hypothetical protein